LPRKGETQEESQVVTLDLVKFPRTPHLIWLGEDGLRSDKVMDEESRAIFLSRELVVEEKVDGSGIGFSVSGRSVLVQSRRDYVREPFERQFKGLDSWLAPRVDRLISCLRDNLILFGEWCYLVHTVRYSALPDWFLAFDVYDRLAGKFLSSPRRDAIVADIGMVQVPHIASGIHTEDELRELIKRPSQFGAEGMEGLYLRIEGDSVLKERAKLVRSGFSQSIQEHWLRRPPVRNSIAGQGLDTNG
jgi:ATP-dependent RNA circularization protein (DNA/RNA ligase family)